MSGLVKHYRNTMQGIPQLSNAWGSMIRLLDAVLVNGFNHIPVLNLNKSSPAAITATINLGSGHGFIDRQVVRIAGSTNGWDGDYKVLSSNIDSIVIECLKTQQSVISGSVTSFTAPLDFETVYQTPSESTKPKRAYRSTDPDSLGLILLVHDFCVTGASETGAKFAKVGVVSSMGNIDEITGPQMPFNADAPNSNWGWDGKYHGWAKWYYAHQDESSYYQTYDLNTPRDYNRIFRIVGDTDSLVVLTHAHYAYGFLEFNDVRTAGKNLALYAHGLHQPSGLAQNSGVYWADRGAFGTANASGGGNSYSKAHVWFDGNGLTAPAQAGCQPFFVCVKSDQGSFAIANYQIN